MQCHSQPQKCVTPQKCFRFLHILRHHLNKQKSRISHDFRSAPKVALHTPPPPKTIKKKGINIYFLFQRKLFFCKLVCFCFLVLFHMPNVIIIKVNCKKKTFFVFLNFCCFEFTFWFKIHLWKKRIEKLIFFFGLFFFFSKSLPYWTQLFPPPPPNQMNFFAGVPHLSLGGLFPCKTLTTFLPSKNYFASQRFRSWGGGEIVVSNTVIFVTKSEFCFYVAIVIGEIDLIWFSFSFCFF